MKASPFMVLSARCGPRLAFPPTEQTLSFAINHIPELPIPTDHYCQYLGATFKLGMIKYMGISTTHTGLRRIYLALI